MEGAPLQLGEQHLGGPAPAQHVWCRLGPCPGKSDGGGGGQQHKLARVHCKGSRRAGRVSGAGSHSMITALAVLLARTFPFAGFYACQTCRRAYIERDSVGPRTLAAPKQVRHPPGDSYWKAPSALPSSMNAM